MRISIKADSSSNFNGEEYIVDLNRRMEEYQPGDLICAVTPWLNGGVPLTLEFAIRTTGDLAFRSWNWNNTGSNYIHTREKKVAESILDRAFAPTEAQIDTVNGLFSGRIRFDGLRLTPGKTLQDICPIDVQREERIVGHKLYINRVIAD